MNKTFQGLVIVLFCFSAVSLFRTTVMLIEQQSTVRDWYFGTMVEMSMFLVFLGLIVYKSKE
jgi:hypothetical protein